VVLERLPEKGDPALAQLKRMRAALAGDPRNVELAVSVARRALDAARMLGDPRFLGQAQAALAPWWTGDDVPASAWLLMTACLTFVVRFTRDALQQFVNQLSCRVSNFAALG